MYSASTIRVIFYIYDSIVFEFTPKFFTFRNVTRNLAGFIHLGDVFIEQVSGDSGLGQRIIKLKTLH